MLKGEEIHKEVENRQSKNKKRLLTSATNISLFIEEMLGVEIPTFNPILLDVSRQQIRKRDPPFEGRRMLAVLSGEKETQF